MTIYNQFMNGNLAKGLTIVGLVLGLPVLGLSQGAVRSSGGGQGIGPEFGDWELTLSGTGTSDKDLNNNNIGGNISVGYFLTRNWEVALRQGLSFADNPGGSSWNGATRGALDYHFDLNRWQPFLGANAGYLYGDNTEESFTAGLEGGIKYYVKPKTFILGRAEYAWIFEDADDATSTFDDGFFQYTIGIGFNF